MFAVGRHGRTLGLALLSTATVAPDTMAATERQRRSPVPKVQPAVSLTPASAGPLLAVIAIAEQRLTLYSGTEVVATSKISSGTRGHPTPTGVFSVIQKNRFHRSNIYSGAPMPFMQRITWSGIAMHAGVLPGYPASHGCIRLPADFASRLFATTRMGMRVVVASSDVRPTEFSHAALPAPTLFPAPPGAAPLPAGPTAALQPASTNDASAELLNPMQWGEYEKRRIVAEAAEARRQVPLAFAAAEQAARAHDAALVIVRDAQRSADAAGAVAAAAGRQVATAGSETDKTGAHARFAIAQGAAAAAETALADAQARERTISDQALEAAIAARTSEDAAAIAADAARAAQKRTEPITILVSRKDQKVYVRQGWEVVLESDAKVADPAQAIGTHVFMVAAAEVTPEGKPALTWKALHVPDGANGRDSHERALERVTLPEAAAREISRRLWAGATLMISDNSPGNETGKYTDLIVQTR